ncbi:N-acetyltransferase [Defluviimonas sp. D31]|uniref:GNAT family N-acetyltransferase n=1 Tax=Defluviimonas sp. D31 TaxID=3083253 RepID=UPI00296FA3BB|nr:N-acetyltransferase [Defluviimonas sp. D31]MDW4548930.1 N-acetyltransferase [Defluviimonas sp. D31]
MDFTSDYKDRTDEIIALFAATFSASEGPDEGRLIGELVAKLIAKTPDDDLFVFSALDDGALAGCILFTRLTYAEDGRTVFLLAPVAVETGRQGRGIGQSLLSYGLDALRRRGVDVAVTYGDPRYYARVGFLPITEDQARAPLRLSQPEGWLAQSLTARPLDPLKGPSRCVAAFDNPAYW